MSESGARAIAVGLSRDWAGALADALDAIGGALAGEAPDGIAGLRLARAIQPDVVVAGAVMPGMDGVAFAKRLRALKLSVRPALVLLRPRGLPLPGLATTDAPDAIVMDGPPDARGLREALARLNEGALTLPPDKAARLEALMDALGVPQHPGRECLRLAVALAWHDRRRLRSLKEGVYPALTRATGLSPAQAARAIRHVIDAAWRNGEMEQQYKLFGDTIDARRGKPTCGEMIAQLAEELRWEG